MNKNIADFQAPAVLRVLGTHTHNLFQLQSRAYILGLIILVIIAFPCMKPRAAAQVPDVRIDSVESREVIAVVPHSWPPQYEHDENGKPVGFAIDVMNEVAVRAGLTVTYKTAKNFLEAVDILDRGEADLIPNSGIVAQRMDKYAFTVPVETFVVSLFVRKDSKVVKGVADLPGRSLAVVEMNIGQFMFGQRKDIEVHVYPDIRSALFQLIAGDIDALVFPQPVLFTLARKIGIEDRIKVVGEPLKEILAASAS